MLRRVSLPPEVAGWMTLFGTLAVRAVVAVLSAVAVTVQVIHVASVWLRDVEAARPLVHDVTPAFVTLLTADAVVSAVAAVLAVVLAFGRRPHAGAHGLAVALASWGYLLAYAGVLRLLRPSTDGALTMAFDGHFPIVETLGLAGIVSFTASFPKSLSASDLARRDTLAVGVRWLQALRAWLLRPAAPWLAAAAVVALVLGTTRLTGRPLQDAGLSPAMDAVRLGAVAVVVLNLRRSWMLADVAERRRMLWIAVGLSVLFVAILLLIGARVLLAVTRWPAPGFAWRPVLLDIGLVGLLWGLAMSVVHAGRLDSAVIVWRVATLGASAMLAILLATGLEVLFSGGLVAGVALPAGLGSVVALGVAIALHRTVRGLVVRVFEPVLAPVAGRSLA